MKVQEAIRLCRVETGLGASDLLVSAAAQMTGKKETLPFIRAGVLFDSDLPA